MPPWLRSKQWRMIAYQEDRAMGQEVRGYSGCAPSAEVQGAEPDPTEGLGAKPLEAGVSIHSV